MEKEAGRSNAGGNILNADQGEDTSLEKPDQPTDIEITEVAKRLLHWKLLLSALEVHAELCERGRELPILRDFFSNPGNFEVHTRYEPIGFGGVRRSASNLTLDSIDDFSRYSDDAGRETDEKVAVLEFELRRAKETIKELRENLTEYAQENEASLGKAEKEIELSTNQEEPVRPFELRALNYLTNEYLLKNEYRLSAITFGEEVGDQDLDDWDDVGVNTPRPPNLLHLFRDYGKHVVAPIEEDKQEIECLKEQVQKMEEQCKELADEVEKLRTENESFREKLKTDQSPLNDEVIREFPEEAADSPSSSAQGAGWSVQVPAPLVQNKAMLNDEEVNSEPMLIPEIIVSEDENEAAVVDNEYPNGDHLQCKSDALDRSSNEDSTSIDEQLAAGGVCGDNQSEDSFIDANDNENEEPTKSEVSQEINGLLLESKYSSKRKTSAAFLQALFAMVQRNTDSRLTQEIIRSSDGEDAVDVVARCLPNVVPNVLLNKREELIPIILCIVRLHPDVKVRDGLLHMLFNLIKRPDEEQRRMIIDGCVAFAKKVGPTRIEAELLPQCWEQIAHKYPERRLLVAETCGCMAPYIPAELLSSLMFSMLKQMIEDDRSEKVREAATRSFALTLAFVDDQCKYSQAINLLMKTLLDSCELVLVASREMLLPVIGTWTLELGNLQSHLLSPLLDTAKSILEEASKEMIDDADEDYSQTSQTLDLHFKIIFGCFSDLIPLLFSFVLQTAPLDVADSEVERKLKDSRIPQTKNSLGNIEVIFGDERKLGILVDKFDKHFERNDAETWDAVDWVCDKCLAQTCELTGLKRCSQLEVMEQLVCFLCTFCRTFGREFTYRKIIPHFEKLMRSAELPFLNGRVPPISSPLLPLFICGVLSVFNEEEDLKRLCTFLKQALVTISTQSFPLRYLKQSFYILSSNTELQKDLVQVLREALVHPSTVVRIATAPLLEILVPRVSSDSLFSQVASALITLSNDREFAVKVATVPALGTVVETRTDKNLLEKICLQLQSLMDDPGLKDNTELQRTLLRTFSRIIPNSEPKFREDFLVHRLRKMAELNSFIADLRTQVDMARELTQSLSALLCCYIPQDLISSQIIPTLRYLERDMRELAPDVFETVTALIADAERRAITDNDGSGTLASAKDDVKNKLLSGFNRLKDASHKKRDIFKKKDRSSTLH